MEFAIAIFIGIWMTAAVVLAYLGLKRDYKKENLSGGSSCGTKAASGKEGGEDA